MDKDMIARINQLAAKKKSEGLNDEEIAEQKMLHQKYIKLFRQKTKEQLLNIKVVDEKGKDVTPKKLKMAKKERNQS